MTPPKTSTRPDRGEASGRVETNCDHDTWGDCGVCRMHAAIDNARAALGL